MVWLAGLGGAGPISETGSTIATPEVAGAQWDLYYGQNAQMDVYSFVADSETAEFSGDLIDFINYLVTEQDVSDEQYLQSAQGGTEPFEGSDAVFTVPSFSLSVA